MSKWCETCSCSFFLFKVTFVCSDQPLDLDSFSWIWWVSIQYWGHVWFLVASQSHILEWNHFLVVPCSDIYNMLKSHIFLISREYLVIFVSKSAFSFINKLLVILCNSEICETNFGGLLLVIPNWWCGLSVMFSLRNLRAN